MPSTQRFFSTNQVSRFTGLTLRQLQWWDERGISVPDREGHNRAYGHTEIVELRIMATLRRKGFSLQRLRRLIPKLRKHRAELSAPEATELFVLTDGHELMVVRGPSSVIKAVSAASRAMAVVSVAEHLSYVM